MDQKLLFLLAQNAETEASINEKGTAHGGQPGDQTGKEFLIRSYRNYPWNCILRYAGDQTVTSYTNVTSMISVLLTDSSNKFRTYSGGVRTPASHDSSVLIGMLYLLENSALETPM